jgi:hypothetical protein
MLPLRCCVVVVADHNDGKQANKKRNEGEEER